MIDLPWSIPSPSTGVWYVFGFPLRAYALCIIAGIIAALAISSRRWQARGGNPESLEMAVVVGVPFGIVGARLYHVITDYQLYFGPGRNPVDALKIWNGGLGIWGAVALGALGGYLVARRRQIRFPALLDTVAPGLVVAQAIGRLGNWFNQELFGRPTTLPWALEIDAAHRPAGFEQFTTFHPTFLYELGWNLGVAAVLIWADRRFRLGHGKVFALYVVLYTAGRFWIEALRIDTVNEIGGFRLNNYTSLIVFVAALAWLLWLVKFRPGRESVVEGPEPTGEPETPAEPESPENPADTDSLDTDSLDTDSLDTDSLDTDSLSTVSTRQSRKRELRKRRDRQQRTDPGRGGGPGPVAVSLTGRLALVTGAARGLGLEIARGLAEAGATVLLNGRSAERLDSPVARLRAEGLAVEPLVADVTDTAELDRVLAPLAPVQILVNNVGHRDRRGVLALDADAFSRLLQTDLVAAYALTRLVARRLVAAEQPGSVVNISSVVGGSYGNTDDVAYPAAKGGLEGLTRALAADLGRYGIRVNAVAPGAFATEINRERFATTPWQDWIQRRSALGRFGRPAEIAGVVSFLAGDSASYLTGQVIAVDGGLSSRY